MLDAALAASNVVHVIRDVAWFVACVFQKVVCIAYVVARVVEVVYLVAWDIVQIFCLIQISFTVESVFDKPIYSGSFFFFFFHLQQNMIDKMFLTASNGPGE